MAIAPHVTMLSGPSGPSYHSTRVFTFFKCVFLSLCLCFDCPLVILCLSASVSERVRIQGDGIVGWAQMSPRKVQQSTAEYNTGQIRTAECSRTQESRAGRRCQQRRSLAVYLASHSHGPRSAGHKAVRSAFLMSKLFIVVGSSVEQDI